MIKLKNYLSTGESYPMWWIRDVLYNMESLTVDHSRQNVWIERHLFEDIFYEFK
jgi:hypothetical protein